MYRPIKIRGWDGNNMLPPQDLSQNAKYWDWLGHNDVILMQFTGVYDKDGAEIYEGDICFCRSRTDSALMIAYFDNGHFMLKVAADASFYKDIRWLEKEVVGNIYENSSLITGVDNV